MKATKIDWCDCTINPVVGCKNGCEYCYARKINDRFKFIPKWEEPQFFPERLEQLKSQKPKSVFMDSMSDIAFWQENWKNKVFEAIRENPQHTYIFLTKAKSVERPYWLNDIYGNRVYFGRSITKGTCLVGFNDYNMDFLSIEPLLGKITFKAFGGVRAVIVGAETGNRKEKVIPKKEWVDDIVKQCDKAKVAVFMKESLRSIMGEDFRQDKLPWDIGEEV